MTYSVHPLLQIIIIKKSSFQLKYYEVGKQKKHTSMHARKRFIQKYLKAAHY